MVYTALKAEFDKIRLYRARRLFYSRTSQWNMKGEFLVSDSLMDKDDVQQVINESIKTYNKLRPHMSNKYLTSKQAHNGEGSLCKLTEL